MTDYLNSRRLSKLKRILKRVNQYKNEMANLSDEELKYKTIYLKKLLNEGKTLDDILPEAYAVVREVSKRVLGLFPYDVQVLGAIALHQGNVAEMKTGEGKTLTATMPAYLNALHGKGVIVVTTNTYLAIRDCQEMGKIYKWLGLSVSVGVHENPKHKYKTEEKRAIYNSDIIYTTNSGLGFDYLIHHLADSQKNTFLRPFNYAIIDEIDAILLDSAQMPLIISGYPRVQSNLYHISNKFVETLKSEDYVIDDDRENVWLTDEGARKAESFFSIKELYQKKYINIVRHIILALKAHYILRKEKDYVVEDDEIKLLDSKLGRVLEGTKLQSGQHQALEAKEKVKLSSDKRAMASITYQNLFRQFDKLSGMTGTCKTEETEFIDVYNMEVISIPTNKKCQRIDFPDKLFMTAKEKIYTSLEYIKLLHQKGQPILIITESVSVSEIYSKLLLNEHIPHNVLHARNAAKEAQIIKEAGQFGAVTIATAMAGRGTDITLGEGVTELGGLAIVGTECMSSKRAELQVRGRSGRQGDPGHSQFFMSLEDEAIVKWGPEWLKRVYLTKIKNENIHYSFNELKGKKYKQLTTDVYNASREHGRIVRQNALDFDNSVTTQRQLVYQERDRLIYEVDSFNLDITQIADRAFNYFISTTALSQKTVLRYIYDTLDFNFKLYSTHIDFTNEKDVKQLLHDVFKNVLLKKQSELDDTQFDMYRRYAILKAMDECWIEQVDYLQQLRISIISQSVAQRNPLYEYRKAAYEAYKSMRLVMAETIIRYLSLSSLILEDGKWKMFFA